MNENTIPNQEPSPSNADWQKWRDVVKEGVSSGHAAGADAGEGSATKLRDLLEKGIYRTSYSLAYGTTFGAILARDVVLRRAKEGASKGASDAGKAARESPKAPADFTPGPDPESGFSAI